LRPKVFKQAGKVLRLNKEIYGLRQSPRNWFLHLKDKFAQFGVRQIEYDACLFVSDRVICIVYVDDTLLFSPRQEYIDEMIVRFEASGLSMEEEDDVAGFMGVLIERRRDGTILMTQPGLTQRIVKALKIDHLPPKITPVKYGALGKDEDGEAAHGEYSYPSVIGMLGYLQGHSRSETTFDTSQCARFIHCTKRSHEEALERIGQYLKATGDKGLILHPKSHKGLLDIDCYVDADIAGLWGYEDKQDPSCVKSCTGYVIFVADCPVLWVSRLQTNIATSTMEAEYNALSTAMRCVLPIKMLATETSENVGLTQEPINHFRTKIWEDNAGPLKLATLEPGGMTPISKWYGIKNHWLRSKLKPNCIAIIKIASAYQRADFLTKSLRREKFEANRKLTLGW
jgi:hypothetical protein